MNYCFASRHYAQYLVQNLFQEYIRLNTEFTLISDICHSQVFKDDSGKVFHARGLQTLFPKNHPKTMKAYQNIGDIGLLAGEKGTSSHLIIPTEKINEYNYFCCHGTGKYNINVDTINIPEYAKNELAQSVFDTEYDENEEFTKDFYNTITTKDILSKELGIVEPIARLAPFINFWGEKDYY